MQKVVGSNPIIRFENPLETAGFCLPSDAEGACSGRSASALASVFGGSGSSAAIIALVSPRAWRWGLLAIAVASMSGCTSGLNGAAVGGSQPAVTVGEVLSNGLAHQFGGKSNLLPNGSFTAGTSPWQPTAHAAIVWTKKPHRFGKTALLARPTSLRPYGARVEIFAAPAVHTIFSLSGWVRGNRGSEVIAQLYARRPHSKNVVVIGTTTRILTGRWQRISVQGRVEHAGAAYVSGGIYVDTRISLTSSLALDGVKATQTSERSSR